MGRGGGGYRLFAGEGGAVKSITRALFLTTQLAALVWVSASYSIKRKIHKVL